MRREPVVGFHFEGSLFRVALDLKVGTDPTKSTVGRRPSLIAEAVGEPRQRLTESAGEKVTRRRIGELEAMIEAPVKEAVFKADQTITSVRAEQETLQMEILAEIKRRLRGEKRQIKTHLSAIRESPRS